MTSGHALRVAGMWGILAVVALRATVLIETQVRFDVDPALDATALFAIGPGISGVLDFVLCLASALALVGEHLSGRGIRASMALLTLLPLGIIVFHGLSEPLHAFRASTWLAAMCGFLALAHLVRERRMREVALSVLIALTALLAVRGAVQVLVEHPAMVELYLDTRDAFLAERGWLSESSAARTYERRLMQSEATGWFGLSNPFSTMMGVGAIGCAVFALSARKVQQSGNTLLLLLASAGCASLLVLNGGKGALAATALAAVAFVASVRARRAPIGALAVLCAAAVVVLVVLRGVFGTSVGELSVLFRSYYLSAAAQILIKPQWFALGVGPDGVQEVFGAVKPPLCPEDVKSVHSIFVDWLVALGISGAAWASVIALSMRGRVCCDEVSVNSDDSAWSRRTVLRLALMIGVSATALQASVEWPIVDPLWCIVRGLGVFAFVMLASIAAHACAQVNGRTLASLAWALALLVLVHAQIETVAWMPSSSALALALLAAGSFVPREVVRAPLRLSAAAVLACAVLVATGASALAALRRDAAMNEIAQTLAPFAVARGTPSAQTHQFRTQEIEARMLAASSLLGMEAHPSNLALEAAIRQYGAVATLAPERSVEVLREAWNAALLRGQRTGARADAVLADIALARLRQGERGAQTEAECLSAVRAATHSQPRNPRRAVDLATVLELLGSRDESRATYMHALALSDHLHLDPLAQLSDSEVGFVQSAIARLADAENAP